MASVALPIALQSVIASSLSLVDNLMVGSLGETELAAVGIAIQIFFIHWMMMFGFTSGASTFMAQFWGAKDLYNIRKTTGFAICICAGTGMLFFVAGMFFPAQIMRMFTNIPEAIILGTNYIRIGSFCFLLLGVTVPFTAALRTTQQTRLPLYTSVVAFATNTFLNYVLIFGHFGAPQLGVAGAALATVIARCIELTLVMIVVFGKKNIIAGSFRDFFGWTKPFAVRIVSNAIPTTINETMWGLGTAMYTAAYARVGITEYAAVQASNTINNLFIMAAFSIGDATLILVGQKLGEGKLDESYSLAKRLLKIGIFLGISFGMLLIICAKPLISLFHFTPMGAHYAFLILLIYGLFMPLSLFNGINITGALRCGGDTRFAMLCEVICVWLIGVPMAFIATMYLHLPIYLAVVLVRTEDIVKGVILLKRFMSKKWVRNVIHSIE